MLDKIEQAKNLFLNLEMYSTKHIKKLNNGKFYYCDRSYPTYDSPDWTTHFEVTEEEAKEIVNRGYASFR